MKQVKMGTEAVHTEATLRKIFETLKPLLPVGMGFTLFVFDYTSEGQQGGHVSYISTASRPTMIATIRAWLKSQGGQQS